MFILTLFLFPGNETKIFKNFIRFQEYLSVQESLAFLQEWHWIVDHFVELQKKKL